MELPRDPEQPQYIQSFTADDVKGIIEFVDQYGVVVIRDVIDQRAVEWSIDAIWNNEELTSRGVRRDDPSTWERCWPRDGLIERKGWIESQPTILSPAAWANRFNGKLIAVYKALLEHKFGEPVDLRVNPDRWGVMRPLLNEEWRTDDGWLHTDQNPKLERDFVRFQGILVLTDSTENTGGFTCVPGFHCEWEQYCDRNPIDEDTACLLPDSEAERLRPEKITARPGSFIIWDSRLPHANYPNESTTQWRMVQYITYYPASQESARKRRIRQDDARAIRAEMETRHEMPLFHDWQYKMMGGDPKEPVWKLNKWRREGCVPMR